MTDTKDMTDEELSEVLSSMGLTVTDEMITKIREQEQAEHDDSNQPSFELDASAVMTSDDWANEFEVVRQQIDEDERLEELNLAIPPQPPIWITQDYINSRRQAPGERGRMYRDVCGGSKFASQAELSALTPILLSDMQVGRRQYGRVLFCRTTTLPLVTNAIRVIVLDRAGHGGVLELYHHPIFPASLGTPTRQDYDDAFDVDTILAIKEPRLTLNSTLMTIKVESVTDVCVLDAGDPVLMDSSWAEKNAEQTKWVPKDGVHVEDHVALQAQVKQLSIDGRYLKIEELLRRAVSFHSGERSGLVDILLERARNRVKLERYEQALSDTTETEEILTAQEDSKRDVPRDKLQETRILRARCFCALGRWEEAEESYRMSVAEESLLDEVTVSTEIERCRLRIREQTAGEYNDAELFRQVTRDGTRSLDVANYLGPINVVDYPDMGRGYRTTRAVKTGELLLVDKAFAMINPTKDDGDVRFTGFNVLTSSIEPAGSYALRMELIYRAAHRSSMRRGVHDLYGGEGSSRSATASRIDGISFVDTGHIDGAVTYNLFGLKSLELAAFAGKTRAERQDQALASYGSASMFNHSCLHNACWVVMGDVLFVRAIKDLPAHEQVFINYCSNSEYLDRRATLEKFLGKAGCICRLCEDDRADGKEAMSIRSDVLGARLGRYYGKQALDATAAESALVKRIADIKADVVKVEATYSDRRLCSLQPALFRLYLDLALHLGYLGRRHGKESRDNAEEVIRHHRLALGSVGTGIDLAASDPMVSLPRAFPRESIMSLLQIAATLQGLGDKADASRWILAAKMAHRKLISQSTDLFNDRYAYVIKTMGLAAVDGHGEVS